MDRDEGRGRDRDRLMHDSIYQQARLCLPACLSVFPHPLQSLPTPPERERERERPREEERERDNLRGIQTSKRADRQTA